jgi:hypothetical protein
MPLTSVPSLIPGGVYDTSIGYNFDSALKEGGALHVLSSSVIEEMYRVPSEFGTSITVSCSTHDYYCFDLFFHSNNA